VIADKALRGVDTGRRDSLTEAWGLATLLQDGQNKGSQHKYATDGQNMVYAEFKAMGRNPTVGEYMERAFIWMTSIYTRADLVVEGAMKNSLMGNSSDFRDHQVKGHAVAQAGYMTWPEREIVGRAIATTLMITLREHFAAHEWGLTRELPLIQGAPHRQVAGRPNHTIYDERMMMPTRALDEEVPTMRMEYRLGDLTMAGTTPYWVVHALHEDGSKSSWILHAKQNDDNLLFNLDMWFPEAIQAIMGDSAGHVWAITAGNELITNAPVAGDGRLEPSRTASSARAGRRLAYARLVLCFVRHGAN